MQTIPEINPASTELSGYQSQPGLDYTLQKRNSPIYSGHIISPGENMSTCVDNQQSPPEGPQSVYAGYESAASPIRTVYGSPSGNIIGRMSKGSVSPQPILNSTPWRPTESYHYSQLSPARSPNGPTYTQLGGGNPRHTQLSYHHQQPPVAPNSGRPLFRL